MSDSPLLAILVFAGALYLFKLWLDDLKAGQAGEVKAGALPGAFPASVTAMVIAAAGALALVGVETAGEIALGVSAEQSDITAIFLLAMLGAGIIEEVVFRGYLVITNRSRAILIGSIVGFSLLFALLHYQYYTDTPEGGTWRDMTLAIDAKAAWSLLLLFFNSLWFYSVRFFKWNPQQSLLPCFVAHVSSNAGVFLVKLLQGHVTALW